MPYSSRALIGKISRRLTRLYLLYIRRDPFIREVRRWSKARGDQTLRLDYPLDETSLVLDAGGYVGDFADRIHGRYGCRVYLFEPSPEFFARSQARFAGNDRITCFNFGLAGQNGEFVLTSEGDASSLAKDHADADGQLVRVRRFAELVSELEVDHIDLLKINIEGGEYELLKHIIDQGLVSRISHIQVQFHNFIPDAEAMRRTIREALSKTHTEDWCFEFVWESWTLKR